jgi:hypothetical protein
MSEDQLTDPNLSLEELTRLEKVSSIRRAEHESKKLEAEEQKLRDESNRLKRTGRSESVRFWVPVLAPSLGSLALVLTLLFQLPIQRE